MLMHATLSFFFIFFFITRNFFTRQISHHFSQHHHSHEGADSNWGHCFYVNKPGFTLLLRGNVSSSYVMMMLCMPRMSKMKQKKQREMINERKWITRWKNKRKKVSVFFYVWRKHLCSLCVNLIFLLLLLFSLER